MKMKKDINLLAASGTKKKFDLKGNADTLITLLIVLVVGVCAYLYVSAFMKKRSLTEENQSLSSYINNPVHQKEISSLTDKQNELSAINQSIDSAKTIIAYVNEKGDLFPTLTPAELQSVKMYLTLNDCTFNSISYEGAHAVITATVGENSAGEELSVAEAVQTALQNMGTFSAVNAYYDIEAGTNEFSVTVTLRNLQLILNELHENIKLKGFTYTAGIVSFSITSTYSRDTVIAYYQALKDLEGIYFKQDGVTGFTGVAESTENVQGAATTVYTITSVSCEILAKED